ncbi:DNA adenine methylase [Roseateles depolymerans]|uniref:D12 class N6 adenine-specific DNA methyltransferase n=1 Tax=Roseateles depolymerans TaxID=76731 RepID=A0A0U3LP17_9BURK|nr:DNA adenine methylase [Roseateles depolymerans]ALV06679.1 D12 class N6 adenine-specific DNA methyltransferase [Roseateles depolymerans]REG19656.1 DNA adenine methylase [Roseateles depolymerans]
MTAITRPALRYHGGKFRLAPWILQFFPPHHIYVEPFGGGASVLLLKDRSYAEIYNDLDLEVVNFFRVLREANLAEQLQKALYLTPFSRDEFRDAYAETTDPVEGARRTLVRSFMGFGTTTLRHNRTGFRAKANRQTQPAQIDWTNYPAHVATFTERLRGVVIENRDALEVMAQQDTERTLFYVDPPYPHETRSAIKSHNDQAYRHEMTTEDHQALAATLHSLKGMVVLSGYACELYDRQLFANWERHERVAMADGARERTEVVWLNPACSAALERSRGGLFAAA